MGESLSVRAEHVMGLARDEALRLHHEYIGTEHILLGIAGEPAGIAADALKSFGITRDQVRSGVENLIGIGPADASPEDRGVSPRAQTVLRLAHEEAGRYGCPRVEPEHLLLGATREVQGVAAQVLRNLQAMPENLRQKVADLLGPGHADSARGT